MYNLSMPNIAKPEYCYLLYSLLNINVHSFGRLLLKFKLLRFEIKS